MTFSRIWPSTIAVALVAAGWSATPPRMGSYPPDAIDTPALAHTCLITDDVQRLVAFYEPILRRKAKWSGPDYAEFPTAGGLLAIFSARPGRESGGFFCACQSSIKIASPVQDS